MVGHTEGNDVVVWGQNTPAPHFARPSLRLAPQHGLDLLRNDRAAEDPGEGVTDRGLELALEPVDKTHVTAHLARRMSVVPLTRCAPRVAPAAMSHCMVSARVPQRDQQNSENRIAAGQRDPGRRPVPAAVCSGLGVGAVCVIRFPGCWGEWRNGRRAGFRCQCPSGRGGSSPPSPTMSGSMNCRHKGHELEMVRDLCVCWGSPVKAHYANPAAAV